MEICLYIFRNGGGQGVWTMVNLKAREGITGICYPPRGLLLHEPWTLSTGLSRNSFRLKSVSENNKQNRFVA